MVASSYATTAAFTISEEGGYTNSSVDSGNWSTGVCGKGTLIGSNLGCGAPATIAYMAQAQPGFEVTAAWMQALPRSVYDGMAQSMYWEPVQAANMPPGLDLSMFDDAWNTGVGNASLKLQRVLGVTQDGMVGPNTLGRISEVGLPPIARGLTLSNATTLQKRLGVTPDGSVGPQTLAALAAQPAQRVPLLILALSEEQDAYYRSLSNFSIYGAGWLARTSRRLTAALSLYDSSTGA
jgi:lysozyme family protein